MSVASKAVFLSYAHEDAAAAAQLAGALRAAGVEVWFDQSELRGGDAWDRKIRKQIKECALFVPVVSHRTQARKEGYFRLEWRLADQRTQMMGKNAAFIVPVCVDDTMDEEADVPDAFLEVQWTRMRRQDEGGLDSLELSNLAQHVKTMIDCGDLQFTPAPFTMPGSPLLSGTPSVAPASAVRPSSPQARPATAAAKVGRRVPAAAWIAAVVVIVVALVYFVFARESPKAGKPAATKVEDKSIAVLPFENRSSDKEANAVFTDGIHEDILTNLAHIGELRVVSRTSVEQYRGTKKPMPQIARELGVAFLLEGSVQRDGSKVRVTGQLIRAATDAHVWADKYDRDLTAAGVFAIQSELAKAIAGELKAALSPQEKKLLDLPPTENLAAYDLYLKAREISRGTSGADRSRDQRFALLEQAVALDPKFALAWASLAAEHSSAYFDNRDRTTARLEKAKAAIDKAVHLAPDRPEVINALGLYYYFGFRDFARAGEQLERAARLLPNNPDTIYSMGALARRTGRWAEAVRDMRRSVQLDPGNHFFSHQFALLLEAGRRYDDAKAERRRLAALFPENLDYGYAVALDAFRATGSRRELERFLAGLTAEQAASNAALELKKRWAVMSGNLTEYLRLEAPDARSLTVAIVLAAQDDLAGARMKLPDAARQRAQLEREATNDTAWVTLSRIEALLGHKEEALRCARKALDLVPESLDSMAGARRAANLALVYAWTGDKDRAFAEYARLLQVPYSELNIYEMKHDPHYAPLRGDPRFEALLREPKNNAPLF